MNSQLSTYRNVPNYPLNLQDAANNRQCVYTCDPNTPWDAALNSCMSNTNFSKITCHTEDATGFVNRIDITKHDGTVTKSQDQDVTSGHTVYEYTFQPGERLTYAKVPVKNSEFE
jgi:hypothetical protein